MGKYPFKKKTYQERAQPSSRKKLGFLEKHKDYVLRAQDAHQKERQLKKLKRLVQNRNPDEFRFGMEHTHVDSETGEVRRDNNSDEKDSNKYTEDEIKLMQTEDIAYLTMRQTMDLRKAEKLKSTLHYLDQESKNTHTLFVDSDDDNDYEDEEEIVAKKLDTVPELIHSKVMPRTEQLRSESIIVGGSKAADIKTMISNEKSRSKAYREIEAREARAKRIKMLAREMDIKRQLTGTEKKYRVYDKKTGTTQFVWRQERKK